ncbi:MAG: ABC transporter ATP-binding protein [Turicibacter sp.]|nr:ABC transporter ATP-binding protein [Turicibacter sp.]
MIRIENVSKRIDGKAVLSSLNLNVDKGSIYGLVGVNGAGKTTIIKHLAGLYRQDEGLVTMLDEPVYDNASLKANMGYIPDELYFPPEYNLRGLRTYYSAMYPGWNEARYRELLAKFGLDDRQRVGKFSKGMQKQAAFLLAISTTPQVFLLDEPLDGLDPVVRKLVFGEIIADVADRQMTVLVSSHNLKEMDGICDKIGIVKGGTMLVEKDLDDLKSNIHKAQFALTEQVEPNFDIKKILPEILHYERQGRVHVVVYKSETEQNFADFSPIIYEKMPLSLEEIFIYEMEEKP